MVEKILLHFHCLFPFTCYLKITCKSLRILGAGKTYGSILWFRHQLLIITSLCTFRPHRRSLSSYICSFITKTYVKSDTQQAIKDLACWDWWSYIAVSLPVEIEKRYSAVQQNQWWAGTSFAFQLLCVSSCSFRFAMWCQLVCVCHQITYNCWYLQVWIILIWMFCGCFAPMYIHDLLLGQFFFSPAILITLYFPAAIDFW